MRPARLRLLALASSVAVLVAGAPLAAQAFWETTAQTSVGVAPASFAVTPSASASGSFAGADGTAYLPVTLTNDGDVPRAARTALTVTPTLTARTDGGGLAVTVRAVLAAAGADCSTVTGYSTAEPVGAGTDPITLTDGVDSDPLLCLAFDYSGATDADNGAAYHVAVGVSAAAGSWSSTADSAPVTFTISGVPPAWPAPLSCTGGGSQGVTLTGTVPGPGTYNVDVAVGTATNVVKSASSTSTAFSVVVQAIELAQQGHVPGNGSYPVSIVDQGDSSEVYGVTTVTVNRTADSC
jgi:hypothetical protein